MNIQQAKKFTKSVEKYRAELANYEAKLNVTDDEEIALKNRLDELNEEARLAAEAKNTLEKDLKVAENPIKAKENDMKVLRREISQAEKKLKNARRRLDSARKEIIESQGNAAEEERTRTRKIAELESDLTRAKERMAPLKEQVRKFLREYEDLEDPRRNASDALHGTERQLSAVQQKIRSLQSEAGGNNALAMFGPKCKQLHGVSFNCFLLYLFLLPCNFIDILLSHLFVCTACPKVFSQIQGPCRRPSGNVLEDRKWKGKVC